MVLDGGEWSKTNNILCPQGAHNFRIHPQVKRELSHPRSQETKSGWGASRKHLCFIEEALFGENVVLLGPDQSCSAHPHPSQLALLLPALLLLHFLGQLPNQSPVLIELELRVLIYIQALHLLIKGAHILRRHQRERQN